MDEEERLKLSVLYPILVEDKRKFQELIDDTDMVLVRIRKDLGIEVGKDEKNGKNE